MPVAVVTGANSGIGNALAALLARNGYEVYALDMTVGDPIKGLGSKYFQVDVTSTDSISKFKDQLGDTPLDLLLNVAGIMFQPKQDSLEATSLSVLDKSFAVNTSGVLLLTQALLPNILAAKDAKIAILSSRVGSMSDNTSGGMYAYRASKAAVNSIGVSLSVDLRAKGVVVLLLHPGINKTNLAGGLAEMSQAFEPAETAERLFKIIGEKTIEDTGKFFQYEGHELPW
ncbi:hypothetical protein H2200_013363 [Cladophialophora chaetospira]|uniref:C-factor n=1 Tax=Cladophialophora chaetospira TaxID=386627 RepID=A0AA38WW58_9EURO|nr:hypothetical protein H2200_013363 [Cladophialophora chaetospira]